MAVNPIPKDYHSVTPYLIVDGADAAIRWYEAALDATEVMRLPMPVPSGAEGGEKVAHAEIKIGDSHVMLSDEWPDMELIGPKARGGTTVSLMIYLPDVDAAFARAVERGATVERAPEDQFWGDRMGTLVDPFGHRWSLATNVEEVPQAEMERRMTAFSAG